jgi:hypothetical protein
MLLILLVIAAFAWPRWGSTPADDPALADRLQSSNLIGVGPKATVPAAAPKPPAPAVEAPQKDVDPLPIDSVGTGSYVDQQIAEEVLVRVVERNGVRGVLRITCVESTQTFRVSFLVRGTNIQITAVEQSQRPRGKPAFKVERLEGADVIRHGDSLDLSWTVRGSSPPAGPDHRPWSVEIKNVRLR